MNCGKFEKQIVLFSELTPEERERVETHLATCTSCKALFESMLLLSSRTIMAGRAIPDFPDPTKLTDNIMRQIREEQVHRRLPLLNFPLQHVRYALAAVSVFFVFFLGVELLHIPAQSPSVTTQLESGSIVVDKEKFRQGLRKSKNAGHRLLMSGCVSPFNLNKVNEACLRERLAQYKAF